MLCYLVNPRGFCFGVSRAFKMVEQMLKLYGKIYISEDLVHNKIVMRELSKGGLLKSESIDDIPDESALMISAHGVSPEYIETAENRGMTIIDATCPIVKSIHAAVEKNSKDGNKIIIIGNPSHVEIVGILGYCKFGSAYVVTNEMDVDLLPDFTNEKVVYFTQTTLEVGIISTIIDALRRKIPNIKQGDATTICNATRERQRALIEVCKNVEMAIVVGSAHSSNTQRLIDVASRCDVNVHRIDSKDDIDLTWFDGVEDFCITSGASAPEIVFNDVVDFLKSEFNIETKEFNLENYGNE